jgi:hypothetical protein
MIDRSPTRRLTTDWDYVPDRLEGIGDVEEPRLRVGDPVLDDPLDVDDIEITREHDRLLREVGARENGVLSR